MNWKYEKEFREVYPETVGETDREFDLDNYKDYLENEIIELQSKLQISNKRNTQLETVQSPFVKPSTFDVTDLVENMINNLELDEGNNKVDTSKDFIYAGIAYTCFLETIIHVDTEYQEVTIKDELKWKLTLHNDVNDELLVFCYLDENQFELFRGEFSRNFFDN